MPVRDGVIARGGSVPLLQQSRTIIKYDWENGERETEMGVVKRFTKLHW